MSSSSSAHSGSGVLNSKNIEREVYLVKVPDVVASFIRSAAAANGGKGVLMNAAPSSSSASSAAAAAPEASSEKRAIGTLTEIGGPARPTFNAAATGVISASSSSSSGGGTAHGSGHGSAAGVGTKRTRSQMKWQLDPAVVEAVLGKEAAKRTPKAYTLNLDEPNGTRIIEIKRTAAAAAPAAAASSSSGSADGASAGASGASSSSSSSGSADASSSSSKPQVATVSYSFFGTSSRQGALVPDMRDPAYDAYTKHRRQLEKEAAASKKSTSLAGTGGLLDVGPSELDFAAKRAEQEAAAAAAAASRAAERAAAAMAAGSLSKATAAAFFTFSGGRQASSIYELFERCAYWPVKEMCEATGKKEADLRAQLQDTCDYIRAGPHRGTHRLKPTFRTEASAAPDPNDGIGTMMIE